MTQIATGNSARKQHFSMGARTACNKKMSIESNSKEEFRSLLSKYPEHCCSKCAEKLKSIK